MKTKEELGKELAYPQMEICKSGYEEYHVGLTKREYFAAMALSGMNTADPNLSYSGIAIHAVNAADALLNELNKGQ